MRPFSEISVFVVKKGLRRLRKEELRAVFGMKSGITVKFLRTKTDEMFFERWTDFSIL